MTLGLLRGADSPAALRVDEHLAGTVEDVAAFYVAHRLTYVRLATLLVDDFCVAEEVVQDVFAALSVSPRIPPVAAMTTYVRTAVVNRSRDVLRRRRTARAYVVPHTPSADSPEDLLLLAEEHREVLASLSQLPARQREVLVLRFWGNLSEQEIAATLGISAGSVKSSASKGLANVERDLRRSA